MIFRKASLRLEALIFFLGPWGFMARRKPNSATPLPGLDSGAPPMPSPTQDPRSASAPSPGPRLLPHRADSDAAAGEEPDWVGY